MVQFKRWIVERQTCSELQGFNWLRLDSISPPSHITCILSRQVLNKKFWCPDPGYDSFANLLGMWDFFLMFFELCIIFLRFPILIILISLKIGLHLDAPSSTTTILLPLPGNISPQLEILTRTIGIPWSVVDNHSILFSTSIPSTTLPKKTCLLQIIRKGTLIIWE